MCFVVGSKCCGYHGLKLASYLRSVPDHLSVMRNSFTLIPCASRSCHHLFTHPFDLLFFRHLNPPRLSNHRSYHFTSRRTARFLFANSQPTSQHWGFVSFLSDCARTIQSLVRSYLDLRPCLHLPYRLSGHRQDVPFCPSISHARFTLPSPP